MADKSRIAWTDASWGVTTGCEKTSPGCKFCYAEREWARLVHLPIYAGREFTDLACHPDRLDQPIRWRRPRMIFVDSMSDLFHKDVPDDFIDHVFAAMALAPQHTFQVLTKRADRMRDYLSAEHRAAYVEGRAKRMARERNTPIPAGKGLVWPLPHVWIGVSVENQACANERIPRLLETPAAIRWISAEPLLGPIDLEEACNIGEERVCAEKWDEMADPHRCLRAMREGSTSLLDWVVVGGESGFKARPMHLDWARSLRDQCETANVPFFFKQTGHWRMIEEAEAASKSFHGQTVRYFPEADATFVRMQGGGGEELDGQIYHNWPTQRTAP